MKFDLHMHSCYSGDGEFTPEALIHMAKDKGLSVVALGDHNQVKGLDEMIRFGEQHQIKVIPTVECDTKFEGYEIHVLAYNVDYKSEYFQELSKRIADIIDAGTYERMELFEKEFQISLDKERIMKLCENGKAINSWKDMLEDPQFKNIEAFQPYLPGGNKSDSPYASFYWEYCFKGAPCYVDAKYPSLKDTVKEIHKAGGIAVLAHPWKAFYQNTQLLDLAISQGIDGIEAYSNYHSAEQNEFYEDYCIKNNVLMTCGSDFHGKMKPSIEMGEYGYHKNDGEVIITTFMQAIGEPKKYEIWDAYYRDGSKAGFDLVRSQPQPKGIYHVVVDIIVQHIDGDYLLMKRDVSKADWAGYYEVGAGGSVLKGETTLEGAKRELYEETGIVAKDVKQLYQYIYDEFQTIHYGYICKTSIDKKAVVLQDGETSGFKWISRKQLKEFINSNQCIDIQKERLHQYIDLI